MLYENTAYGMSHNQQRHEVVTSWLARCVLSLMTVVLLAQCLRSVSVFTVIISHVWAILPPGSLLTLSLHDIWRCYLLLRGKKISSLWDQHVACLFASVCLLTACLSVYSLVPHFKFQSTVRFSQHRYEHCSIKSHPKLPHLISYSR